MSARKADPDEVWRLWCQGLDTHSIARLLGFHESAVYHSLQMAREARRRPVVEDHPVATPKRQPPLEDE